METVLRNKFQRNLNSKRFKKSLNAFIQKIISFDDLISIIIVIVIIIIRLEVESPG
jgi:hypothetical protein